MEEVKIKYYLVLERRHGDYNLIDVNKLDICDFPVLNDIASLDAFTSRFTEEELKKAVQRSNMVTSEYLDGSFKIISDLKHNLKILTKEHFETVIEFQKSENEIDPNLKNKLYGTYKKIVENLFKDEGFIQGLLLRFKQAIKNNNKAEIFRILEELPYAKSREIYFAISDKCLNNKQANMLNLKKVNDAA